MSNSNAFDLLSEEKKNKKSDKIESSNAKDSEKNAETVVATGSSNVEVEDAAWTVQSSKAKKATPQAPSSKHDLGPDSSRAKLPTDGIKKKVVRHTREELIGLRRPTKILSVMSDMLEIVSLTSQDPVSYTRLEPEDVVRIWESDRNQNKDNAGRGRGRGRKEDGVDAAPRRRGDDLWDDDGKGGGELDLEAMAARALQFRSEMREMKLPQEERLNNEDTMERLMREQRDNNIFEDDAELLGGDEEDEDLPDWAMDGDTLPSKVEEKPVQSAKRSLLLETLNVKAAEPTPAAAPIAAAPAPVAAQPIIAAPVQPVAPLVETKPAQQPAASSNFLSDAMASSRTSFPAALEPIVIEWLYTDPQGQVQGPFAQDNMRMWQEAGYFNADLPIKLRHWSAFYPFHLVYGDSPALAFRNVPLEPSMRFSQFFGGAGVDQQAELLRKQAEQQRQQQYFEQQAEIERQRKAEEEKRAAALEQQRQLDLQRQQEIVRQEQLRQQQLLEQQRILEHQRQQDQVRRAQQAQHSAPSAEGEKAPSPTQKGKQLKTSSRTVTLEPTAPQAAGKHDNKAQDKGWKASDGTAPKESLASIQKSEKEKSLLDKLSAGKEQQQQQQQQQRGPKGWAASGGSSGQPSLAEIQQQEEEESRRQQQAASSSAGVSPTPSGGGGGAMSIQLKSLLGMKMAGGSSTPNKTTWEAQASSGPAGRSLKDIMHEEATVQVAAPEGAPVTATGRPKGPSSWAAKAGTGSKSVEAPQVAPVAAAPLPKPVATIATINSVVNGSNASRQQQQPKVEANPASGGKSTADFGGKAMSRDMAEWCAVQLHKINGSSDLTLMDFCMSLQSGVDIRETLASYLGSSPLVTNFATEFIQYKESGKRPSQSSSGADVMDSRMTSRSAPMKPNSTQSAEFVAANKKKKPQPNAAK